MTLDEDEVHAHPLRVADYEDDEQHEYKRRDDGFGAPLRLRRGGGSR